MQRYCLILLFLFSVLLSLAQEQPTKASNSFPGKSFSLRTNLPTWLLAMPSLGIEYKTSDRTALIVDGVYAHWNFKRKEADRFWHFWNVAPQVRRYVNADCSTYVGLQYSMGRYNLSSQQGEYLGGGFTFGKQYYAGKNLLIDLGLSLGYLKISTRESYRQIDGEFYRNKSKQNRNYYGPTSLSVNLVRKF
ncbi:DUF3575 domain-containing protein [Sphingobacterium humi]|uniref:DUF3575 domain-containing protein n=1 Tax=Sphingobacterium humi TaxID=1796905 RepID=A0A6N8KZE1_9SPHI|nr:DUF3575 domain-containing protein [Sphingobacterium humi]MVZ62194.1 DUF3575 domain-containing protein [Sphingobacterium humi]